jgi:hypothetical protein
MPSAVPSPVSAIYLLSADRERTCQIVAGPLESVEKCLQAVERRIFFELQRAYCFLCGRLTLIFITAFNTARINQASKRVTTCGRNPLVLLAER